MRRLHKPLYLLLILATLLLPTACQGQSPTNSGATLQDLPTTGDYRITAVDAKTAYDSGNAIIIDTRSLAAYDASHIKGAVSMPYGEEATRYTELDAGKWIIAYCT
jgi:3-mercaptopyruvate sulfurtransferase SseA